MDAWQQVTDDHISLQAIAGVKISLKGTPPLRCNTKEELDERRVDPVIDEAITELLNLKAVQVVTRDAKVFLSRYQRSNVARSMAEGSF